jgi:hypothetical protein
LVLGSMTQGMRTPSSAPNRAVLVEWRVELLTSGDEFRRVSKLFYFE